MSSTSQARLYRTRLLRSFLLERRSGLRASIAIWLALFLADILTLGLLIIAVPAQRFDGLSLTARIGSTFQVAAAALLLLCGLALGSFLAGRYTRCISLVSDLRQSMLTGLLAVDGLLAFGLLSDSLTAVIVPATIILLFSTIAPCAAFAAKRLIAFTGIASLPAIVVGDGEAAYRLAAELRTELLPECRLVRVLDTETAASRIQSLGLERLMSIHGAKLLIVAGGISTEKRRLILEVARGAGFPAIEAPSSFTKRGDLLNPDSLGYLSTRAERRIAAPADRMGKVVLDLFAASALVVFIAPILIIVALAVKLDGGPVLFRHTRLGARGTPFRCLKFRTMRIDSDAALAHALAADPALAAEWALRHKLRNDPRVTKVGRFLRSTSLDELPQLFNVLRLEMSLVGPRPIVAAEADHYGACIEHYFATRPGITGLWQVSGRSDTTYQQRVALDVRYAQDWSPWLDALLLIRTIPAVLCRRGAY